MGQIGVQVGGIGGDHAVQPGVGRQAEGQHIHTVGRALPEFVLTAGLCPTPGQVLHKARLGKQLFAAFAQNIRQSYQAFQHALAAGPARREKLVLQVPLTMASRDLVYHDLLLALSQELPDCDLEVRTDTSCTSPEEVLQSGVDALVQMLLEPVSDAIDCLPLFDTKCHLLASPGSPLSACGTLTPDQLAGQTICFESCDAVFVSMVRRCMEDIPLRWLMVPDFEKEYVRMLAGKCLFLSPVRSHGYPPEWFHPLIFPFPPAPTCLFTRKDDTRPCLQVLRQLTLAEHRRAVADGRL